ncbi:MAG: radical SAM family heme chaperone HemW [Bryobacteraceae bacterium]
MPGVYVSYPFCAQKCTYCNFASGVLPAALEPRYLDALCAEIASHAFEWPPETVYLGGGTPSRLAPGGLARILQTIPGSPWPEATIEAAPGDITTDRAAAWRDAGINRASLGVQSFVDRELRQTGRRHNARTVAADVDTLRRAGIENINLDLIAGLPWQTQESWRESLEWIRRLDPPHVSVYLLEVDGDSRLGQELLVLGSRYGAANTPGEEQSAAFYETAVDSLAAIGIDRYEISNFAKPGHRSLHNLKYWLRLPYVGFGADAHSFDGATRRANTDSVADYIERVENRQSPCIEQTPANPTEEQFFVGLRLDDGIELSPADRLRFAAPIARFTAEGLLESRGPSLRFTRRGVLLSNEVLQEFLAAPAPPAPNHGTKPPL